MRWEDTPPESRITEAVVLAWKRRVGTVSPTREQDWERKLRIVRGEAQPGCQAAERDERGRWWPCWAAAVKGTDRCYPHGGRLSAEEVARREGKLAAAGDRRLSAARRRVEEDARREAERQRRWWLASGDRLPRFRVVLDALRRYEAAVGPESNDLANIREWIIAVVEGEEAPR